MKTNCEKCLRDPGLLLKTKSEHMIDRESQIFLFKYITILKCENYGRSLFLAHLVLIAEECLDSFVFKDRT